MNECYSGLASISASEVNVPAILVENVDVRI